RDLRAHLVAKQLIGAARIIAPDESERCVIFEPTFWGPVELPSAWWVSGYKKHASEGEEWSFFVRRRELDRLYPVTAAKQQTPGAHGEATPQRRKPGPKDKTRLAVDICRRGLSLQTENGEAAERDRVGKNLRR